MSYTYPQKLRAVWDYAVTVYATGERSPEKFIKEEDSKWILSVGLKPIDVFDSVDDFHRYDGEPNFETFLLVSSVRKSYLDTVQKGILSTQELNSDILPSKQDEIKGVAWLPRIIVKAKSKLRGELPDSIMLGCAGDRKFLKDFDIHPAELLQAAWAMDGDDEALADWVIQSKK